MRCERCGQSIEHYERGITGRYHMHEWQCRKALLKHVGELETGRDNLRLALYIMQRAKELRTQHVLGEMDDLWEAKDKVVHEIEQWREHCRMRDKTVVDVQRSDAE